MLVRPTLLAIVLLSLVACSSTSSLDYTPTVSVAPGPLAVSAVTASDMRNEKPNRLATVRGGYGNPVYVRDTARPVADEIAAVFTKALQARGMLTMPGQAPYRVQLIVRDLHGNQYVTRNAYIDMDLIVADRSGRTIYRDTVKNRSSEFTLFGMDVEDLQRLVQVLLNSTVDRMLDNPNFRAALSLSPPGAPLT